MKTKGRRIGRIASAVILLLAVLLGSINVSALEDGDTIRYGGELAGHLSHQFWLLDDNGKKVDYYQGSCCEVGNPADDDGKAKITKLSLSSNSAKIAYYVYKNNWLNNFTGHPLSYNSYTYASLATNCIQISQQGKSEWKDKAVNHDGYAPAAFVEDILDKYDEVKEAAGSQTVPSGFEVFLCKPTNGRQPFLLFGYPPTGHVHLTKAANKEITINDTSKYSLAGAVYYVYKDEACADRAKDSAGNNITLTTKADGTTNTVEVLEGTYWAKEITASPGYDLDKTTRKVKVTEDNTKSNPATFKSVEPVITGHVTLTKKAAQTDTKYLTEAPNNYSLEGAKYELYSDSACTKRAKDISGNNITLTTKADGTTNTIEVSIGSYYAKEVTASKGFKLDNSVRSADVTAANTASKPAQLSSTEDSVYAPFDIQFRKVDISGHHGYKELLGTEYTISYYDVDMGYGNDAPTAATIDGKKAKRSWIYKTVKKTDQNGQPYAGFNTKDDQPESGSSPFYTESGNKVLPRGVFTIEETKAAPGMAKDKTVYYCRVFQAKNGSGAAVVYDAALTSSADLAVNLNDDEQHPVIEVQKKDADTEETSPQGTDRDNVKGSLAGAKYDVYYDDPAKSGPEKVGTIVTDEKGYGKLEKRTEGDDRFIGDWLPLGRYYIEEVSAPDGYTVDAMYYENKDDEYKDGQHIVSARAQTGDVESFTYTVESFERPHHTHIYKTDLVTTKEIPGATLQVFDSKGNMVEEWESTEEPHDIVALHDETQGLKDGKYTLREITAPYGYDIAEDIVFEVKSGKVTNKVEMKNAPISIYTNAVDEDTQTHQGTFSKTEKIKDLVKFENLYAGRPYTFKGTLMDKETGEPLKDKDGNEVTAEKEYTPEGEEGALVSGEVELEFIVDASEFTKERSVVAFEKLYREGREIAMHADLKDADQTIHYGGIAATVAVDAKSKGHSILGEKDAVMVDTVKYQNLAVNETYTVEGELFDKTTGKLTGIKAKGTFKPSSPDGSTTVEFKFDASGLKNHKLVAFEKLYIGDKEIDKHEDPNDADQTVNVPEIETIAVDPESNEHIANAAKSVTVKDTVKYSNLVPGKTYTLKGTLQYRDGLMKKLKTVMKDGKPLTAETSFKAESESGSVDVTFVFDAVDLAGKTTVVFEDLYDGKYVVATHADPDDEGQSVHFPKIATKLGTRSGSYVVDAVKYENLIPGEIYVVRGYFVEKSTGNKIEGSDGEYTFFAEKANGKVAVKLDPKESKKTLVAFESVYLLKEAPNASEKEKEILVGEHKDLNDKAQTLTQRKAPATGDTSGIRFYGILFAGAMGCMLILAAKEFVKKRRQDREDAEMFA